MVFTKSAWSDVTPIPQDDGPNPPVPINYSEEFVEVMNYFRAVLQNDERSDRALSLTSEVIDLNAANYTAWYFRRLILQSLEVDLREEFKFTESVFRVSPKNYQLWFHRRWLVEQTNEHHREWEFTAMALEGDSKNYHAWSHRQFTFFHFNLQTTPKEYKNEENFLHNMIARDVRNNSAWNCYYYLCRSRDDCASQDDINSELAFVWKHICHSPNNQSSWSYLRGFLKIFPKYSEDIEERCKEFINKHPFCQNVLIFLVDLFVGKGTKDGIQVFFTSYTFEMCIIFLIYFKFFEFYYCNLKTVDFSYFAPSFYFFLISTLNRVQLRGVRNCFHFHQCIKGNIGRHVLMIFVNKWKYYRNGDRKSRDRKSIKTTHSTRKY